MVLALTLVLPGLRSVCSGLQSAAQRVFNILELVERIVDHIASSLDVDRYGIYGRVVLGRIRLVNATSGSVVTPVLFECVRRVNGRITRICGSLPPHFLVPSPRNAMSCVREARIAITAENTADWVQLVRAMPSLQMLSVKVQCSTSVLPKSSAPLLPPLSKLRRLDVVNCGTYVEESLILPGWLPDFLGRPSQPLCLYLEEVGIAGPEYAAFLGERIRHLDVFGRWSAKTWRTVLPSLKALLALEVDKMDDEILAHLPTSIRYLCCEIRAPLVQLLAQPQWLPDLQLDWSKQDKLLKRLESPSCGRVANTTAERDAVLTRLRARHAQPEFDFYGGGCFERRHCDLPVA